MTAGGSPNSPRPVRLYVLTGGRARPSRNTIRAETLVRAAPTGRPLDAYASQEAHALMGVCGQEPRAVVEAAAALGLPVSVVAVLVSDLVDSGHLVVQSTPNVARPNRAVLERLLAGLREL